MDSTVIDYQQMTFYTAALATLQLYVAPGALLQYLTPPSRSPYVDVRPTTRHALKAIKICSL